MMVTRHGQSPDAAEPKGARKGKRPQAVSFVIFNFHLYKIKISLWAVEIL